MKQPLFTINSTFSEEEVVRFNKYVILHMFHYVRNVIICNIILLLFTVGMIVNDITSEDFPIGSIMMFLLIIIVNWSLYKSPIQKARKVYRKNKTIRDAIYIVKFYDDHYVVTCNEIESSIPFDKLYKIIETDTNYYLMASKVSGTIICKADCPNDFIGHVTPKLSSITYSTTTAVTDVITSILFNLLLYALPPLIIPPDNAFYYIIISPASNARQGSVIMLINVDKVTAPTASFWS